MIINIYNPCTLELRNEVWEEIESFWSMMNLPCLIMGDFNEVLSSEERGSHQVSQSGISAFKTFINSTHLMDIPPSNGSFSWFSGNSKSLLDRLLVNPERLSFYPSLKLNLLNRTLSDHCPILASSEEKNWGPKPFRFLNCWLDHPNCLKIITESWNSNKSSTLPEKLKAIKISLKKWNTLEFGSIDSHISNLEIVIQSIDGLANLRNLEDHELVERKSAQCQLWEWLKRKESLWAQKSRIQWLKEGDKNTRFFHTMASINRRKNLIESISHKRKFCESPSDIQEAACDYFHSIFTEKYQNRPTFSDLDFKKLSSSQISSLITPFTTSEIDDAMSSCAFDKAPGPDGFNFRFIKNSWEVIKEDVYKAVNNFCTTSRLPHGSNIAFIALIPKTPSPSEFKDFRPISMVGSLYKIIAKLLARRLQKVINSLISPFQTSFIKGRQILDGALIASKLIDTCKKKNIKASIFKIDFHKAFDSVSWSFLT